MVHMKVVARFVSVAVFAMATLFEPPSSSVRDLERLVEVPQRELAEKSKPGDFELQAQCAQEARKAYLDLGYPKGAAAGYTNHYNAVLHTCFLHVAHVDRPTASDEVWNHRTVFDTLERTARATYAGRREPGDREGTFAPAACEVVMPSGAHRVCRSEEEFTELVNVYMEVP
jgi:hypothetical protein